MSLGDHEHVNRCHRPEIAKRNDMVVLVDDLRGDLLAHDLAEEAAIHGGLPGFDFTRVLSRMAHGSLLAGLSARYRVGGGRSLCLLRSSAATIGAISAPSRFNAPSM